MTNEEFTASVDHEVAAIARRARIAVEIDELRDEVRMLNREDEELQRKRLESFRKKCAAIGKLYRLESELDALARRGTA